MATSAALPTSPIFERRIVGEVPAGAIDGANQAFTTASFFIVDPPHELPAVHFNGQRLPDTEYSLSESGGLGAGYDTITLVTIVPIDLGPPHVDTIRVDYTEA